MTLDRTRNEAVTQEYFGNIPRRADPAPVVMSASNEAEARLTRVDPLALPALRLRDWLSHTAALE